MAYLILLGMMGSGKTTVGRRAAELSGVAFEDTDQILVRRLGRSISQIFQFYGEDAFRGHETSILASLEPGCGILATGGGIVLKPENWSHFRRLGHSVFLDVPGETLIERLAAAKKRRPLLEVEGWEQKVLDLLAARRPLYSQADHVLPLGAQDVDQAASELLRLAPWETVK